MPWWRRKKAEEQQQRVPMQRLLELEDRVAALDHKQEQLDHQFKTLRGYVYVRKGLVGAPGTAPPGDVVLPPVTEAANTSLSKEELRRKLVHTGRFIPGQRPIHRSEGDDEP